MCVCLAECLSFLLLRLPDKASLDHPAEVDLEFNRSTYTSRGCEGQKGGGLKEERVGSQPTQQPVLANLGALRECLIHNLIEREERKWVSGGKQLSARRESSARREARAAPLKQK